MGEKRFWNRDFILLTQGQAVSAFGDAIGDIALDFYVLSLTGSTAVMGSVMAIMMIPRIVIGPIAGSVVDRADRKKIIVAGDVIRGLLLLLMGIMGAAGRLTVGMIFLIAAMIGICTAFFHPAVEALIPSLISQNKLMKANSVSSMTSMGAQILGQSVGGGLYGILGAVPMFVADGFTYLISAFSETFIRKEKVLDRQTEKNILMDLRDGLRYMMGSKGLVILITISVFINFLFGMVRVLLVPWFANDSMLGAEKYGMLNAAISVAVVAGMLFLSVANVEGKNKHLFFSFAIIGFDFFIGLSAFVNIFAVTLAGFFVAFFLQIIFNTIIISTIMQKTPEEMRGKVAALRISLVMTASPAGNLLGGFLGESLKPASTILAISMIAMVMIIPMIVSKSVKEYIKEG